MTLDETAIAQIVDQISEIETQLRDIKELLTESQQTPNKEKTEPHYTTINESWYSENSGIEL